MSEQYTADDGLAAMRCVNCPRCGAMAGSGCMNWHGSAAKISHKRRVDKYYETRAKELLEPTTREEK